MSFQIPKEPSKARIWPKTEFLRRKVPSEVRILPKSSSEVRIWAKKSGTRARAVGSGCGLWARARAVGWALSAFI